MTFASAPGPLSVDSWKTLPLAPAEAERRPVELAVALDDRPLGAEDPRLLVDRLGLEVRSVALRTDDELDHAVDQRRLVVSGDDLLPDLGLGASSRTTSVR